MERIRDLEVAYTSMLREGIPGLGIRVLDHGVAGGMLLLLHSTLYFRLHFGLKAYAASQASCTQTDSDAEQPSPRDPTDLTVDAELWRRIRRRLCPALGSVSNS
jgi:hypothetical protein